jgi:hypothetical protein
MAAFFEINRKACLKLQKVSGYFGKTNKMFIGMIIGEILEITDTNLHSLFCEVKQDVAN